MKSMAYVYMDEGLRRNLAAIRTADSLLPSNARLICSFIMVRMYVSFLGDIILKLRLKYASLTQSDS